MALCLEMFLNKLMRCMALFLVIYLNVIGLCKLAAVLACHFNVLNLEVILMVECEGKDLWEWVHCRLHGNLLRDLSNVAGHWWDLTVRQAQIYYQEWKVVSPLQGVQLQPHLPDELLDGCYTMTEQRGVHLLLKAVSAEQQQLVVDRDLSSTAMLFGLYIRHQPGGPGEKAILLGELTTLQKSSSMQELATSLRTWRRHFARAREVDASLPDGVLLLKALEDAVQKIAKEDAQASFPLSTSRQHLALDERPTEQSIWSFSQCLLAEAETWSWLKASATTSVNASTPVKLMDAAQAGHSWWQSGRKGPSNSMSEQPCKFFRSESGCKAGKSCKWSHSWEGIEDRNSRCWICGGKDHRKSECKVKGKVKGNGNKPASGEPGLGGGRGGGSQANAAKTAVKNVAVQGKGADVPTTKINNRANLFQYNSRGFCAAGC